MRLFSRRLAAAAILANTAVLTPLAVQAAPPAGLTEQGRLFDNTGNPLNATVSLTLSIYAGLSGGTAVWTETQASVTLDEGYFSIEVGSVMPIPQSVWTGATMYVGIAVNADPEMSPRQPGRRAPTARRARPAWPGRMARRGPLAPRAQPARRGPRARPGPPDPRGQRAQAVAL
jgi:hypothetical protein